MKPYTNFIFVLYVVTIVHSFECPVLKEVKNENKQKLKLYDSERKFTVNFLKQVIKVKPESSIFFSPFSIYQALLLAYFGSDNKTQEQFKKALYLDWSQDNSDVFTEFKHAKTQHLESVKSEISLEFESVDKYFFDMGVEIRDCMKTLFSDEIEQVDLQNKPNEVKDHINAWIEKITKHQIKNLLSDLSSSTKLAIANAAYFKGNWYHKFDTNNTEKQEFYKTKADHFPVDMMKQKKPLNIEIHDSLNCISLDLPYNKSSSSSNAISFIAVLPLDESDGALETMFDKMTPNLFENFLRKGSKNKIEVFLPKFSFEQETQILTVLEKMGFKQLLTDANFSGFSESTNIVFNDVIHKAKIEVDESGSTASAATVMKSRKMLTREMPKIFRADRPFLYLIYDHTAKAVLFAGVYKGPM